MKSKQINRIINYLLKPILIFNSINMMVESLDTSHPLWMFYSLQSLAFVMIVCAINLKEKNYDWN